MKRLLLAATLALCAIMSTGCAAQAVQATPTADATPTAAAQSIASIASADLDAAIATAQAHNDVIGLTCFTALKNHNAAAAPTLPKISGALSALEAARVGVSDLSGGLPQDLLIGCAPLVTDSKLALLKLGGLFIGAKALPAAAVTVTGAASAAALKAAAP